MASTCSDRLHIMCFPRKLPTIFKVNLLQNEQTFDETIMYVDQITTRISCFILTILSTQDARRFMYVQKCTHLIYSLRHTSSNAQFLQTLKTMFQQVKVFKNTEMQIDDWHHYD